MDSVAKILKDRKGQFNFGNMVTLHRLRQQWADIVGEKLAAYTYPYAMKDKKLYLNAESSVWLNEIEFLKGDILRRIRKLADGSVEAIQGRVGIMPNKRTSSAPTDDANLPRRQDKLSAEAFSKVLAQQAAPEIKEALQSLYSKINHRK